MNKVELEIITEQAISIISKHMLEMSKKDKLAFLVAIENHCANKQMKIRNSKDDKNAPS